MNYLELIEELMEKHHNHLQDEVVVKDCCHKMEDYPKEYIFGLVPHIDSDDTLVLARL